MQIKEYVNKRYEIVEDHVVKPNNKRRFLVMINAISFIVLFAVIAAGILLIEYFHGEILFEFNLIGLLFFIVAFVVFILAHELVHGLAFRVAGKVSWKNITYGVVVKSGMAYCITEVPVKLRASRISLLAPLVVICLPIIIYAIAAGNVGLLIMGAFFVSGSSGDLWYIWILRRKSKNLYMIEEKPKNGEYKLGCYLVRPID